MTYLVVVIKRPFVGNDMKRPFVGTEPTDEWLKHRCRALENE